MKRQIQISLILLLIAGLSCRKIHAQLIKNIPVLGFYDNAPKNGYPLAIFNTSGKYLGIASTKAQVVSLWNADGTDITFGTIASTGDSLYFSFNSPANRKIDKIIGASFKNAADSIVLIGTSYFTSYAQTPPYLYEKIRDYWVKTLTGYTDYNGTYGNNGKTAHDRIRAGHFYVNGLARGSLFCFWNVNDMLYRSNATGSNLDTRTILKVSESYYTFLSNAFSKSFHYFVDEGEKYNVTTQADASHVYGSKSFTASKNIAVLNSSGSYVEFKASGKCNITYFISDGVTANHGTFKIYVNDVLYDSVDCNNKTINLARLNPSIATNGDTSISPNSIVLNLTGANAIRVERTSASNPVWLDYWSEIETNIDNGAKPVYALNCPAFVDGSSIPIAGGGSWTADNDLVISINAAVQAVFDFWHNTLGAPAFLGDVYTGWVPTYPGGDVVSDLLHMSQSGTDKALNAFNEVIKKGLGGNFIFL